MQQENADQSGLDFMTVAEVEAARCGIDGDVVKHIIINGLKPQIKQFILGEPEDFEDIKKCVCVAEATMVAERLRSKAKWNVTSERF